MQLDFEFNRTDRALSNLSNPSIKKSEKITLNSTMQETWTFSLPHSNIPTIDEVKGLLAEKQKELGIFLSYYFKKEGALAEKVNLGSEIHFKDQSSGEFTLEFDLIHFNACLAINEQKRDQMKITFLIEGSELTFKGPYWPEREMDEI